MKCKTIEQYKLLEMIKRNFEMSSIKVETIDNKSIRVTDFKGESMVFNYSDWFKSRG